MVKGNGCVCMYGGKGGGGINIDLGCYLCGFGLGIKARTYRVCVDIGGG